MQRISSLAACREFGGLVACTAGVCARKNSCKQPAAHRQWDGPVVRSVRLYTAAPGRRLVFAGVKHRLFCSQHGADGPKESSGRRPAISVVGIPDPITWIRCKVIMFALDLYFELDVNSEEFERGVKQVNTDRPFYFFISTVNNKKQIFHASYGPLFERVTFSSKYTFTSDTRTSRGHGLDNVWDKTTLNYTSLNVCITSRDLHPPVYLQLYFF